MFIAWKCCPVTLTLWRYCVALTWAFNFCIYHTPDSNWMTQPVTSLCKMEWSRDDRLALINTFQQKEVLSPASAANSAMINSSMPFSDCRSFNQSRDHSLPSLASRRRRRRRIIITATAANIDSLSAILLQPRKTGRGHSSSEATPIVYKEHVRCRKHPVRHTCTAYMYHSVNSHRTCAAHMYHSINSP